MLRSVRLTLYVLLLALFCSLGDGPFVDEVLADQGQQEQQTVQSAAQADNAQQPTLLLVYSTLMHAAGTVASPCVAARAGSQTLPCYAHGAYVPPALSPPDKPPRFLA